jgi:hypothetical protein
MKSKPTSEMHPPLIIGWRERVDLPKIGLLNLPAKIDTGARTSALHAAQIEEFERDRKPWVRFSVQHFKSRPEQIHEQEIFDAREIKNTSGVPELRFIIRTPIVIAGRKWKIDLSLADRGNMQFPLIVGRSALSDHRIAVDAGRSYLTSRSAKTTQ